MYYTTEHILIIILDEQMLCTKYILDNNIHKLLFIKLLLLGIISCINDISNISRQKINYSVLTWARVNS